MNRNLWKLMFGEQGVEIIESRDAIEALSELLSEQQVEHYLYRRADIDSPWTYVGAGAPVVRAG
ncbi:hypothetical protein ACIGKQ_16555 [Gordonia sp. NPDC062954]|uniref:hypothetical protein n=1 Tax=unclassified Gordonia (in: high G+C Gram-positive bacteria) TaxID=2657482 RepID=UPI000C52A6DD|nr:hypothetical protein [Gordonia sp. (in: high G+C Gram-positive bacteria)]MAU83405.1 hypothetical protein [Gordonia sp. (in: high G+C Gram-positive bacteria)]